jgi:hypothetical protein
MRENRKRELSRVMEKGAQIDNELVSKCAYYPLFRFCKFVDKKTGDLIVGQQLVCKNCSIIEPNLRCKHSSILSW